jgi:hypothetical protein
VILRPQLLGKARQIRREHVDATAVELPQLLLSSDEMNRRPSLGPGFSQDEKSAGKLKRREGELSAQLGIERPPVKPPGNHQMNDKKEIVFQNEDDPLAKAAQVENLFAGSFGDGRIERADNEGISHDHAFQHLLQYPGCEAVEIQNDIGKFGHGGRAR